MFRKASKVMLLASILAVLLATAVQALATPSVTGLASPTHPDENAWYPGNNATFTWSNSDLLCEMAVSDTRNLAVAGNRAFIASGVAGITIADISNDQAPAVLGTYDTPGTALDVAVSGQNAIVADDTALRIVNVSNPASPVQTGYITMTASRVSASGNYAYVISSNTLRIIDISNPASPWISGTYTLAATGTHDLEVSGSYAYVTDVPFNNLLRVIDVSNPAAPVLAGSVMTYVYGGGLAVGVNPSDGKKYAYIGSFGPSDARIVDVSNPAAPVVISTVPYTNYASDVAVNGSRLYIASSDPTTHDASISVFDISNPAAPASAGGHPGYPKGSFYAAGITTSGSDLVGVGSGKLRIYRDGPVQYSWLLDQTPGTAPDNIPEGSYTPSYNGSVSATYNGLAAGEYYFHVATVDGTGIGPVSQRRVRIDPTCGTAPALSLAMTTARWASFADYQSRLLTIDIDLGNSAGATAYGAVIAGHVTTNGVTMDTVLPQALGDLVGGSSTPLSLRYSVPLGVSYFRTQIYATASDRCGGSYSYPGPFPGV